MADPGASWGSLETGISGGSCGTGGREGGRAIVVVVVAAECRVVAELILVRGPKAGDEAGEAHAVCPLLCKQLASRGSPHPHPQGTEAGDWRYIESLGRTGHSTSSGPAPKHFRKGY